jgi:hypothetical protein
MCPRSPIRRESRSSEKSTLERRRPMTSICRSPREAVEEKVAAGVPSDTCFPATTMRRGRGTTIRPVRDADALAGAFLGGRRTVSVGLRSVCAVETFTTSIFRVS